MKARWTAFLGGDPAKVLAKLGWVATGGIGFQDNKAEMLVMPSGWRVVVERVNKNPAPIAALVDLTDDVVAGYCTTVAMGSELHGKGWDIEYDCSREEPMKTSGDLPAAFTVALDHAKADAANGDEQVDYMWDVPLNVSKAICGYHPEEFPPEGAVTWALDRPAKGASDQTRSERKRASMLLSSRIKAELVPQLFALGFERAAGHPDRRTHDRDPNSFLRRRGDIVDEIFLLWGLDYSGPQITLEFMTRAGEPVLGQFGRAFTRFVRGPSLFQRLRGVRPTTLEEDVQRVLTDAGPLLAALDRYLTDGVAHPDIVPPIYNG